MPIVIEIDRALFRWQSVHGRRMNYSELASLAGLSLPTLNRYKAGEVNKADLEKINRLCKVLECEPGDLLRRVSSQSLANAEEEDRHIREMLDELEHKDE